MVTRQIHRAAQHPVELDQAQADAVEARTILDLRLGAAFTRMQTMTLQGRMPQLKDIGGPISYGPCQFPTLGFVVSRYEQIQEFVPETFWYIYLSLSRTGVKEKKTKYKWIKEIELADEIPKSASGKILRRVLRDQAKAGAKGLVIRHGGERARL